MSAEEKVTENAGRDRRKANAMAHVLICDKPTFRPCLRLVPKLRRCVAEITGDTTGAAGHVATRATCSNSSFIWIVGRKPTGLTILVTMVYRPHWS